MAGRPVSERVNIEKMRKLVATLSPALNAKPMIAYTLRNSGATYDEIGKVFKVSRQMGETLVKQMERELEDD